MRKTAIFLVAIIMTVLNFSTVFAAGLELYYDGEYHTYKGNIYSLYVNDKKINPPLEPIIFNDRALVPIREVFEALGQRVDYDNATRKVTVSGSEHSVVVQIENNIAYVNGKKTVIPDGVVPKLITKVGGETKTMVPVRFVSESVGLRVEFHDKEGAIKISNPKPEVDDTVNTQPDTQNNGKIGIKKPVISKKSDTVTVITINLTKPMTNSLKSAMTSAGVLYFDITNAYHESSSQNPVDHGAVKMVRLGLHDDYTRVAVDLDKEKYEKNSIVLSEDKMKITITITAKGTEPEEDKPDENTPTEDTPNDTPNEDNNTGDNVNDDGSVNIPENNTTVSVDLEKLKDYTSCNGVKRVVLDPGHGGNDPGALGTVDGKTKNEKSINLSVAKLVKEELEARGIEVLMTRSEDATMSLDNRSKYANKNDAAMYVSIHVNAASNAPKANGIEVFYASQNNDNYYGTTSKNVAKAILDALIDGTGATNRGVKVERHYVTRTSLMPAVLIELGFITNESEAAKLVDGSYQKKLANAIADGIEAQLAKITVPGRKELAEKMVAEEIGATAAKEYIAKNW